MGAAVLRTNSSVEAAADEPSFADWLLIPYSWAIFVIAPPSANLGQIVQKRHEVIIQDNRASVPLPRDEIAGLDRRVDRRATKAVTLQISAMR